MRSRNEELPLPVEIQQTEDALRIYDGLAKAMREPAVVLDVVLEAEDADAARTALQTRLDVDEIQAMAVLDMQFRRATQQDRRRIEDRRQEIEEHLQFLRNLDAPPSQ
jgi:DNA gyrase subunit A